MNESNKIKPKPKLRENNAKKDKSNAMKIQIAQNINICRYKCLFPFNTLSVNAEF